MSWVAEVNHMQEVTRHRLKEKGKSLLGHRGQRKGKGKMSMLKEQVEERMVRDI